MVRPVVGVAGLGAMGGAIAYHLASRGASVVGFDRYRPPHAWGSSHGQTRIIREAYFEHPGYVPLVRRAFEGWRSLERDSGRALLRTTGALTIGPAGGSLAAGAAESAREHGIAHEILSTGDVRRRYPQLMLRKGDIAVHEGRGGVLAVESCVLAHLEGAESLGAELRYGDPVTGWESRPDGVHVRSAQGWRRLDALVLAAGPWLPRLVDGIPLRLERQVTGWFRGRSGTAGSLGPEALPVLIWETGPERMFYVVPDLGAGVKAARHHGGEIVADVASITRSVHPSDLDEVGAFLSARLPAALGRPTAAAVCIYTNTASGDFLIDRHPADPRVVVVSACSGHGFKFAPAVGGSVAEMVIDGRTDPELEMFGWGRVL